MDAFTNIEKSHTRTARPGTSNCRPYKNLFGVGIKPATPSVTVDRSATALTVPKRAKKGEADEMIVLT